jgi:hypothetical protein
VPLPLALAARHVHSRSPEDEEDVFHRWEATDVSVTTILLGLAILHGGATVVLLERVALLEGVVDRGLVVWARLLQHIVEHAGASRAARGPFRTGSTARAVSAIKPYEGFGDVDHTIKELMSF